MSNKKVFTIFGREVSEENYRWFNLLIKEKPEIKGQLLHDTVHNCIGYALIKAREEILKVRTNVDVDYSFSANNLEELFLEPFFYADLELWQKVMNKNGWIIEEAYKLVKENGLRLWTVISCSKNAFN